MKNIGTVILVVVLILGAGLLMSACGWYNQSVRLENSVTAQYLNNQNSYDAFWKKVKETAQVADHYKNGFKDVLQGAIEGRYADGGGQMMKFITEANPSLDPSLYRKVQDVIESGRNEFQQGQRDLLDKQRSYKNHLQQTQGAVFTSFLSFPKVKTGREAPSEDTDNDGKLTVLDYKIVTSVQTQEAFSKGEAAELDVFGK